MQHASNVELTYCSLRINHLWNFDSIGLQIQILEIEKMNIAKSIQANPLSHEDLKHIATQINAHLDIPWVPEAVEQYWIEWMIDKVISVVPGDLLLLMADAADGLTADEIAKWEVPLTDAANELIDLPYFPESVEAALIRPIVRQLLQFAATGNFMTFRFPQPESI